MVEDEGECVGDLSYAVPQNSNSTLFSVSRLVSKFHFTTIYPKYSWSLLPNTTDPEKLTRSWALSHFIRSSSLLFNRKFYFRGQSDLTTNGDMTESLISSPSSLKNFRKEIDKSNFILIRFTSFSLSFFIVVYKVQNFLLTVTGSLKIVLPTFFTSFHRATAFLFDHKTKNFS